MTAVSLDFESEELRARRMEAIGAVAAQPIQTIAIAQGISALSSIAKAEERDTAVPQFRPQLEQPKHFMYGLIRTHGELERVSEKQTSLFEIQAKRDMEEVDRLDLEKREVDRKSVV